VLTVSTLSRLNLETVMTSLDRFVAVQVHSTLSLYYQVAPPQNVNLKIRSNLGVFAPQVTRCTDQRFAT